MKRRKLEYCPVCQFELDNGLCEECIENLMDGDPRMDRELAEEIYIDTRNERTP